MQFIVRGTTVGPTNPQLVFYNQVEGFLSDVASLTARIIDVSSDSKKLSPAEVLAAAPIDVTVTSASRLGVGRYCATWASDPALTPGLYMVEWVYQLTNPGPTYVARYPFEVVTGLGLYAAGPFYCGLSELRDEGFLQVGFSDARAIAAIQRASLYVESITRRFFEPRFYTAREDGRGGFIQKLNAPIIGLDNMIFDTYPYSPSVLPEDTSLYRIYNRHLAGLLQPDDRNNSRLGLFTFEGEPTFRGLRFPRGQQNIEVTGVFGYTDPDGTPVGSTPADIRRVTQMLVARDVKLLSDVSGREDVLWRQRIASEKTRDQMYTLESNATLGLFTGYTGDPVIDQILIRFIPPVETGSA